MHQLVSVNNISSAAYGLVAPNAGYHLEYATPAKINEHVMSGHYDAALLPAACLESVAHEYEAIGEYGIACRGAVGSVLLCCDLALETIARENLPVFVSEHSKTSRALFQYLYKTKFGVAPLLADHASDAFARLYIGNDALESSQSNASCSEIIDLSEWWYRESELPFVFARWVVRSSLTDDVKETIEGWLDESVQVAATPEGKDQMALNNKTTFGSMSEAVEYYQRIHFHLGYQELSGLSQFKTAIKESSECISIG